MAEKRKLEGGSISEDKRAKTEDNVASRPLFGNAAASGSKGIRDTMEDEEIVCPDMRDMFSTLPVPLSLYAVFDGHGGKRAATYAKKNFPSHLSLLLEKSNEISVQSIKESVTGAYDATDKAFLEEAEKNNWPDGCTGVVAVIHQNIVTVGNVGDSKAILYRQVGDTLKAVPLTKDHVASRPDEKSRIESKGGFVEDGRVNGQMEVSRTIGDAKFKKFGVISKPGLTKFTVTPNDQFMVIACDGLWTTFNPNEVGKIVSEKLAKADDIQQVTNELVLETVGKKRCKDNVTAIIVLLSGKLAPK